MPGTATTLSFSDYHRLLSRTELDLCVIEGLGALFGVIVAAHEDRPLLPTGFTQQYGEVQIMVRPVRRLWARVNHALVVNVLRGIAIWVSQYYCVEVTIAVYDHGINVANASVKQARRPRDVT